MLRLVLHVILGQKNRDVARHVSIGGIKFWNKMALAVHSLVELLCNVGGYIVGVGVGTETGIVAQLLG